VKVRIYEVYTLESIQEQMKYADFLISKRLISDTFKEASQVLIAIQLCKDLELPISCLKDFYVISGKPSIFGDTFVALALGSGVIQEHVVNFYDEDGEPLDIPKKGKKVFSCTITGRRKGATVNSVISYSMEDKESSGNNNPNFKKHPRDMLFRRAMGRFIKWTCADAIRGIEMTDYAEESVMQVKDDYKKMIDIDHPIPKEEAEVGPLYRFQNSKYRGKQFYEITTYELTHYYETLKNRTTQKKPWEIELMGVLQAYLVNIDSYRDMILELLNEETK